jgi:cation transport regulator
MPYQTIEDLPESVRENLPKHAQEIFKEAFNSASERYQDPAARRDPNESAEEVALKVAWSAVKERYRKDGDRWVRKEVERALDG